MGKRARSKIPPDRAALTSDGKLIAEVRQASSVDELLTIVRRRKGHLTQVSAATCLYQLAKKQKHISEEDAESQEVRILVDTMLDRSAEMDPYSLSNVAWSVVQLQPKLGKNVTKLMPAVAEQAIMRIGQFNPRYSSATAWAFAKVSDKNPLLFEQLTDVFLRDIEEANEQDISNMAWSLAELGIGKVEVMKAIANRAASIIDEGAYSGFEGLGLLVWSFATLGLRSKAFLDAAAERAESLVSGMPQKGRSQLAWGYWRLGMRKPRLLRRICAAMREECGRLDVPSTASVFEWSTVVSAAAEAGMLDDATVAACVTSMQRPGLLREATKYSIAALFRVAEMDGWRRKVPAFYDALAREVQARGITQAEWDNTLIADVRAWTAAYG